MSKFIRQIFVHGLVGLAACVMLLSSDKGDDVVVTLKAKLTVWAYHQYVVQMAMTNHTPTVRTVAKVATSCACLTAESAVRTGETPVPSGVALLIELMSTHIMPHDIRCCNYIMPHDIMSSIGQSHAGIGLRKAGVG